ncbi:hypothetical protein LEMLEM_LOCUS6522, partial [Lemmus lemmus]
MTSGSPGRLGFCHQSPTEMRGTKTLPAAAIWCICFHCIGVSAEDRLSATGSPSSSSWFQVNPRTSSSSVICL